MGRAVKVTWAPREKDAWHVTPHCMPTGLLVTIPRPETRTERVDCLRPGVLRGAEPVAYVTSASYLGEESS